MHLLLLPSDVCAGLLFKDPGYDSGGTNIEVLRERDEEQEQFFLFFFSG